jgi:hypothetical protein
MPNLIVAKIDVRKLEKARFFEGKSDKNGHKPLYCDVVLIPKNEVGQYGDTHLIVQSKKKEENIQMPIIGSATERGSQAQAPRPAAAPKPAQPAVEEDEIGF